MMYFVDRLDYAISLFIDAKILLLTFLSCESTCNLMHDIIINMTHPLYKILNLCQKASNIHSYNTRSSNSGNFYVKKLQNGNA